MPTCIGGPVFTERTGVGLDVHARSVAAAAIDTVTGEVIERRLDGDYGSVIDLAHRLEAGHGPLRITYEAGPPGSAWPASWPRPV